MKSGTLGFDRAMAGLTIIIGCICLFESIRLLPLRSSLLSGDHALPGITGAAMIILGLVLLFTREPQSMKAGFPGKPVTIRLVTILGILAIYAISIQYLGYVVPTVLFGIPLFRLFGGYKWIHCVVISIICAAGLYGTFVFGLGMSFPRGPF